MKKGGGTKFDTKFIEKVRWKNFEIFNTKLNQLPLRSKNIEKMAAISKFADSNPDLVILSSKSFKLISDPNATLPRRELKNYSFCGCGCDDWLIRESGRNPYYSHNVSDIMNSNLTNAGYSDCHNPILGRVLWFLYFLRDPFMHNVSTKKGTHYKYNLSGEIPLSTLLNDESFAKAFNYGVDENGNSKRMPVSDVIALHHKEIEDFLIQKQYKSEDWCYVFLGFITSLNKYDMEKIESYKSFCLPNISDDSNSSSIFDINFRNFSGIDNPTKLSKEARVNLNKIRSRFNGIAVDLNHFRQLVKLIVGDKSLDIIKKKCIDEKIKELETKCSRNRKCIESYKESIRSTIEQILVNAKSTNYSTEITGSINEVAQDIQDLNDAIKLNNERKRDPGIDVIGNALNKAKIRLERMHYKMKNNSDRYFQQRQDSIEVQIASQTTYYNEGIKTLELEIIKFKEEIEKLKLTYN